MDAMNVSQHYRPSEDASNNNSASPGGINRPLEQPKGWRVKLYRLNSDGSWDDCGTGRIQCLYKQPPPPGQSTPGGGAGSPQGGASSSDSSTHGDQWLYQKTGEATLCAQAEMTKQSRQPRVLLRTRILLRDAYQRQGDNIITWCEPCYTNSSAPSHQHHPQHRSDQAGSGTGVDLALSFQDNAGCLDIWRQITHVQSQAAEWSTHRADSSVQRLAAAVAAQHHADLVQQDQQQQQQSQPSSGASAQPVGPGQAAHGHGGHHVHHHHPHHQGNAYHGGQIGVGGGPSNASTEQLWSHMTDEDHVGVNDAYMLENVIAPPSLPDPPTLRNLEEVVNSIADLQHVQQRESLAMWIAKDECRYLKALLALFGAAEQNGDYEKLAALAGCVKTILLLNDPSIVELIVTVADLFEQVCACLEYDPDLREKANHRWFLRERAKFRTVVPMDDPELVAAIHRSFRVNYMRDTLLRPTMDESSLSALTSMQTFADGDIVKGVTLSPDKGASLADSYLMRLIRVFGNELHAISVLEWMELDSHAETQVIPDCEIDATGVDPSIVVGQASVEASTWKQYLAPQDGSLRSRRMRRRGCLSFLRELFGMVRNSLQQSDKDDFFAVICGFEVELGDDISDNTSQSSQLVEVGSVASTTKSTSSQIELPPPATPVTLLSLLGDVLCDPNTDATEKGCVMEIIGTVAMHDSALIRRHCLSHYNERRRSSSDGGAFVGRPDPNESKQVVFQCPHNDLLASLIFLLDAETDAGVLLQVSEIMRLLLDTDMMGDHGPPNAGFADETDGIAPYAPQGADTPNPPLAQGNVHNPNGNTTTTDQKQFLTMFYEHYVEWLVAPFQFQIFQCICRVPTHVLRNPQESALMENMLATFRTGVRPGDPYLRPVQGCAMRDSFAVELLSFCVRAHLYRMKFFLLKSRVLGNVLELLRRPSGRCLKLAALRFLRAVLSVNDEFYHRHIIQNDLFGPVFAAFRTNPVGDNLVSSAIIELCDFIHAENITSLLEYVVTKHLSATPTHETIPSLEDVSSPYVTTLTVLRKAYESQQQQHQDTQQQQQQHDDNREAGGSRYFPNGGTGVAAHTALSGQALEEQRKFQQADAEASYFESDGENGSTSAPPSDDLLHRTPRMFSFPTQMDTVAASSSAVDEPDQALSPEIATESNPEGSWTS